MIDRTIVSRETVVRPAFQGFYAYFDGQAEQNCPHPAGSFAAAEWVSGWQRAANSDPENQPAKGGR